eukprot:353972-Chlamydomonas_euryale.AAC.5
MTATVRSPHPQMYLPTPSPTPAGFFFPQTDQAQVQLACGLSCRRAPLLLLPRCQRHGVSACRIMYHDPGATCFSEVDTSQSQGDRERTLEGYAWRLTLV